MRSLFPPQQTSNPCANAPQKDDATTISLSQTTEEIESAGLETHKSPDPPNPLPQCEKWQKRHLAEKRELLPVDLRFGPAAALLIGNILYFAHYADQGDRGNAYEQLLIDTLNQEIFVKAGRQFPRRAKPKHKTGKRNKGNLKAQHKRQYQRRKARRLQRQLRRNAET